MSRLYNYNNNISELKYSSKPVEASNREDSSTAFDQLESRIQKHLNVIHKNDYMVIYIDFELNELP